MSRPHQDQVIDEDEDEFCPLCVEEFDLADRSFYPCPCGFQICQFCHNKIKNLGNCACPACRRPYEDANIKWEAPSAEETASHKLRQAKKKVAAKQKEILNREADNTSRKHLAGIRVRRQNLVYVTGLKLNVSDTQLSEKLRGDQFFGQYGKIDKIVVNKPKESRSLQPVGVYITYFEKESAALCIAMVNGSQNAGGTIRADYGTTKYCSAYLRNETCTNRNCTFLHEAGEENESFTREGLSSLNMSIQSSSPSAPPNNQPPPPLSTSQSSHPALPVTSQSMERQDSRDRGSSPVDSSDGSALPSSASWAHRNASSRRPSQVPSLAAASPLVTSATPTIPTTEAAKEDIVEVTVQPQPQTEQVSVQVAIGVEPQSAVISTQRGSSVPRTRPLSPASMILRKYMASEGPNFSFDDHMYNEDPVGRRVLRLMQNFPPLFDADGGVRRQLLRKQEAEQRYLENDQHVASQALSTLDLEENAEGGSLQLGGEPEDRQELDLSQHHAIRPPSQNTVSSPLSYAYSPSASGSGLNGRIAAPQQQQQVLLQQLKSVSPSLASSGYGNPGSHSGQFAPGSQGHSRQTSRFSFANDTASASASVKPVANAKLMNQQSSMMPPQHLAHYNNPSQHQSGTQLFTSGVQGPPPGLKATGTPPVSGGGMFGQGHGFATAGLGYGVNGGGRNANDEMMRELLRNRGGSAASGRISDGGRREYISLSILSPNLDPSPPSYPVPSGFQHAQIRTLPDHDPQKQKKKGKKHRHANTSSFGGGVDDLADPSILQARLHQSGGAGQGIYGAQGQGQADTLKTSTPTTLLQNEPFVNYSTDRSGPINASRIEDGLRRSTPTLPPGLTIPADASRFVTRELDFNSRDTGITSETLVFSGLGIGPDSGSSHDAEGKSPLKTDRNGSSVKADRPREVISGIKPKSPVVPPVLEVRDISSFPALPKLIASLPSTGAVAIAAKASEMLISNEQRETREGISSGTLDQNRSEEKAVVGAETSSNKLKRQHPGKLDISAATRQIAIENENQPPPAQMLQSKVETPIAIAGEVSITSSTVSRSDTPALSLDTPVKRSTQPRTIRVLATPKAETPTAFPGTFATETPLPVSKPSPVVNKQPSRRPSMSSIIAPGTPASERPSDNQSATTGSMSRANSPPPSKVGSAPIRSKTKSQQKKDRLERAKLDTENKTEAETAPAPETVTQEPIIGRKKKTKRTAAAATATSTPEASRPSSPGPAARSKGAQIAEVPTSTVVRLDAHADGMTSESPRTGLDSPSLKEPLPTTDTEAPKKSMSLPATIIADLQVSGELDMAALDFFKTVAGLNHRHDITAVDVSNVAPPTQVTAAERAQLDAGEPVRRGGADGRPSSRVLITPSRKCLRGLTLEMENSYLELERRINATKPPLKYHHRRDADAAAKIMVDEILKDVAAALTQPPNTTAAAAVAAVSTNDTAGGVGRVSTYGDDALGYLNQFILPPLPSRGKPGDANTAMSPYSAVGNSIPRTYTTGDPTYSVFGVDVNTSRSTGQEGLVTGTTVTGLAERAAAFSSLSVEAGAGDPAAIKKALANAVNGVVAAAAAVAGASNSGGGSVGFAGLKYGDEELEKAFIASRKECEGLEKRLAGLLKKNRRIAGL